MGGGNREIGLPVDEDLGVETMQLLAGFFTRLVSRYLPDAYVLAVILTLLTFVSGIIFTSSTPVDMVGYWGKGVWSLLTFTMQMCLVIVTGHALASTKAVKILMQKISATVHQPAMAAAVVALFSAIMCSIQWGFGLIVAALLARQFARHVKGADYRVLVAAAYMGFMTWHAGLMASIPLVAATPGHLLEAQTGLIPVTDTIFSSYNMIIVAALYIILPIVAYSVHPKPANVVTADPKLLKDEEEEEPLLKANMTPAERLENSRILAYFIGLLGLAYIAYTWATRGFVLDLNLGNLLFLALGLLLHGSPITYAKAIKNGAIATASVMLQFPFYGGIQYMMEHSGMAQSITHWFVDASSAETFPALTFFASGVINFVVPSGGGHWIVQGPLVIPAALDLGVDVGVAAMAISYGDMWSNMAQPFWALPALAVAGLGIRDIMGFTITAMVVTLPLFMGVLFFLV